MVRRLADMVVVITGASAGIGRSLAELLSARGARLVLAARRIEILEELNRTLGGRHLCVQCDVSKPDECASLVEQSIAHLGRIDTLVCNAGYGLVRTIADTSSEEMRRIFDTNVFGTTDCIRAAVPRMRQQELRDGFRGQVMIVSSAAGRRGLPYFGAYAATKFAQIGISEALRVELKDQRIAVTSIHPIGTETDFFTSAERLSDGKVPQRVSIEFRQSSETVARKMLRAIEYPKAEVWPFYPVKLLITLGILMPWLGDAVMRKAFRAMEKANKP